MISQNDLVAIVIAVIGAAAGVWSAYVARSNRRDMQPLKQVINNSKSPVETLDGVIKSLQEEMRDRDKRHTADLKYLDTRLEEALQALAHCQHERSSLTIELEDVKTILREHGLARK